MTRSARIRAYPCKDRPAHCPTYPGVACPLSPESELAPPAGRFWRGFLGRGPVYGADNHSPSLFSAAAGAWNLAALDSLLRQRIRKVVPGERSAMTGLVTVTRLVTKSSRVSCQDVMRSSLRITDVYVCMPVCASRCACVYAT